MKPEMYLIGETWTRDRRRQIVSPLSVTKIGELPSDQELHEFIIQNLLFADPIDKIAGGDCKIILSDLELKHIINLITDPDDENEPMPSKEFASKWPGAFAVLCEAYDWILLNGNDPAYVYYVAKWQDA